MVDQIFKIFAAFNKVTALLEQCECIYVFQQKPVLRWLLEVQKLGKP